jgi:hypothetical protein
MDLTFFVFLAQFSFEINSVAAFPLCFHEVFLLETPGIHGLISYTSIELMPLSLKFSQIQTVCEANCNLNLLQKF